MFTLSIETVTGRTFTLKADGATTTVGELKAMIAAQEGVPAEAQVLSWKGRTLGYAASSFLGLSKPEHDERTLSYYSIEADGESIQLVLNPYVLATLRESALEKPAISSVSISSSEAAAPAAAPSSTDIPVAAGSVPPTATALQRKLLPELKGIPLSPRTETPASTFSPAFQEALRSPNDIYLTNDGRGQPPAARVASAMVVSEPVPKAAACCVVQ